MRLDPFNQLLPFCLRFFGVKLFNQFLEFEINQELPETTVSLNDENTELNINYKVTVQKGENSYNLYQPYEVVLPLRVKKVLQVSRDIAGGLAKDNELDVSKVLSYGMNVDDYDLGNGFRVVAVKDNREEGGNYEMLFGVRT